MKATCMIFFPLINGFFAVLKSFENIPKHSWNARKSQSDPQKSYEELGIFGGLRLIQFVSSLTADHYFWCSGGVPCCFEGVPGYYGMFQGCSGAVPGCSGMFRGCFGDVPGCSGVFRVLQTPNYFSLFVELRLKGTLSRGFFHFGVKTVITFKLNAFSHTQNTPRTSREGNQIILSKEKQTIVSYWWFFQETKEKLENISLMFSSCNHPNSSDLQPNTFNSSLRELVE